MGESVLRGLLSDGYHGGLPFDKERKVFINIKKAVFYLNKDGSVTGKEIEGTWEMTDGTYYMHLPIGEKASAVYSVR